MTSTRWGGPADYLDDSTGILIDQAARRRVQERYDWQGKIDQIIGIYREAQARA